MPVSSNIILKTVNDFSKNTQYIIEFRPLFTNDSGGTQRIEISFLVPTDIADGDNLYNLICLKYIYTPEDPYISETTFDVHRVGDELHFYLTDVYNGLTSYQSQDVSYSCTKADYASAS